MAPHFFTAASSALFACLALLTLSTIPKPINASSFTVNVAANELACFYAWADAPKKKIGFYFAVQSGGSFDIDIEVKDPNLTAILTLERERQGDYVLNAKEIGEYSFCFSNDMSTFADKVVDFEITVENELRPAQAEQDGKGTAPQPQAQVMDETLYRLSDELNKIDKLQKLFKTRENRNFSTVISTDSRIFWFSMTESAMIVVMAVLQVFVIRTFFSNSKRSFV
ncbi:hypothetical protein BGZ65_009537 [Modicella reniformis]|uniref:GOLD domain-containing protein n=1 Tax=Modicella reniformis TaxID=1440133 RepID=A0A9P6JG20_9FUNG|nr:hypothetical protein BGZ65_009537 [Modicella reniformis]